ncbi:FRIGIDA-like protein 5 [Linum grandiflorum]
MERLSEQLKVVDSKQASLRSLADEIHAQCSTVLRFTLQWKDLEQHFESMRSELLEQATLLSVQEKQVVEARDKVRAKEIDVENDRKEVRWFFDEMKDKEEELGLLQGKVLERRSELEGKEKEMGCVQNKVRLCTEELQGKEKELGLVERRLNEMLEEIAAKEVELDLVNKSVDENCRKFEGKEKELGCVQNKVRVCTEDLQGKEKELGLVERRLNDMREEIAAKEVELDLMNKSVDENCRKLEGKEKELGCVQNKVRVCTEDLQGKEKELGLVERRLNEMCEEIAAKEVELDLVDKSVDEKCRKLKGKQKEVEEVVKMFSDCTSELELKDKKLSEVKELIKSEEGRLDMVEKRTRHCREELGLKEKELASVRTSIKVCVKELGWGKEELQRQRYEIHEDRSQVDAVKLRIEELEEELELKEVKFNEVNKSVKAKQKQLESVEETFNKYSKRLQHCNEELESKTKKLGRVKEEIVTSVTNLQLKQAELSEIRSSVVKLEQVKEQQQVSVQALAEEHLSKCAEKLELKMAQLNTIRCKLTDCNKKLAAKKQDVDSMKQKLEKDVEQIKWKEKELESRQKLLEERNAAVEEKEKEVNNLAESCSAASVERCIQGGNGRNLQSLLNEHFKKHDLLLSEVLSALLKSPDPARLVLDGMFGFYPQGRSGSSGEYELSVVRKSCIALLELLSRIISAQMKPQVSEESVELARDWKSRIVGIAAPANSLEVLGLLKLISAFRLPLAFKHSLLKAVNAQMKADVKAESFADNLIGSFILTPTRTADEFGNMYVTTSEEGSYPQLLPDEPLPSELSTNEITSCLENSPDPAKMVLGLIRDSLVEHESGSIKLCDQSVLTFLALLLQQLMRMRPFVLLPSVKEEVTKLAVTWRASLRMEALDILVFLLFLGAYLVADHFDKADVESLAGMITQYKKAPKLWLALGLEGKVPGLMKGLMKKDMHMEAARFSCAFRLVNEYPPHLILLKFLEKSRTFESGKLLLELQSEAFNKHMNFLKQLIQRVKELNFDPSPLNMKLLEHFRELARLLQLKTSCLQGVAASIDQSGLEHHHRGASSITVPGYPTGQVLAAAAQYPTSFTQQQQQQQQPNWTWQGGELAYQAQRNKRTRTDHMQ